MHVYVWWKHAKTPCAQQSRTSLHVCVCAYACVNVCMYHWLRHVIYISILAGHVCIYVRACMCVHILACACIYTRVLQRIRMSLNHHDYNRHVSNKLFLFLWLFRSSEKNVGGERATWESQEATTRGDKTHTYTNTNIHTEQETNRLKVRNKANFGGRAWPRKVQGKGS